jgi:hypothetical protein
MAIFLTVWAANEWQKFQTGVILGAAENPETWPLQKRCIGSECVAFWNPALRRAQGEDDVMLRNKLRRGI